MKVARIVKAPETITTSRLVLRKPVSDDAGDIFERYASDAEVTRYLAWPMHASLDDTRAFLEFSDAEWNRWPAGPYLICSLADGRLLGSTGLAFEAPFRATTGYVLARDSWGQGFATEALLAMRQTAMDLGVRRLYAMCTPSTSRRGMFWRKGASNSRARYGDSPNSRISTQALQKML